MKIMVVELKRAEEINEYGVKRVNRLCKAYSVSDTGREYNIHYIWNQDVIQRDGKVFTSQIANYKGLAYMEKEMVKCHFNFD